MAQKFKNQIDAQEGIKITNELYDGSNAAGSSGQVLSSTGTGTQWIDSSSSTAERIEVTVKNVSGGSLSKGTVVHAAPTATPPSGNVIEVIKADANDAAKMPAIGVLNETIADEAEGAAVMFGAVSGIDTSSFTIGDELYVSTTAGAFTATKPTANDELIQKIAIVIKSHGSNGLIKVFGAGRSNDVPNKIDRNVTFAGNISIESTLPRINLTDTDNNDDWSIFNNNGTFRVYNATDSADSFNIDGNGNVGFNVIPENSSGTWRNLVFGSLSMFARPNNANPDGGIGTNFKFTTASAEQRISAHATSRIWFNDDVINFQNAGTGTANSAITWNTRMIIDSSGNVGIGDDSELTFGNSSDLKIYHSGSDAKIENSTGDIEIRQNTDDGLIRFYNDDGSGQLQPYITLDGSVKQTKFTVDTLHEDGFKALFGDGSDLQIYHNAFHSYINNSGTGDLIFTNGLNATLTIDGSSGNATFAGDINVPEISVSDYIKIENGNSTYTAPSPAITNVPLLYIRNSNNTESTTTAHALITLRTQINGGDPFIAFDVENETGWTAGMDNADNNFKITTGWSDVGGDYGLIISTTGELDSSYFATNSNINSTGDGGALIKNGQRLGFDESGTRSWTVKAASGQLNFYSGDGLGAAYFFQPTFGISSGSAQNLDLVLNNTAGGSTDRVRIQTTANSVAWDLENDQNLEAFKIRYATSGAGLDVLKLTNGSPENSIVTNSTGVGIGMTPSYKLDVNGNSRITGSTQTLRLWNGSSNTGVLDFGQADFLLGYDSGTFKHRIWDGADYFNAIQYNGPSHELYLAKSEGSVGIRTTDNDAILKIADTSVHTNTDANNIVHISRNNHAYIKFSSPDNYDQGLHFYNTTDNSNVGRIAYLHSSSGDVLDFIVGGSNVMEILGGGGVKVQRSSDPFIQFEEGTTYVGDVFVDTSENNIVLRGATSHGVRLISNAQSEGGSTGITLTTGNLVGIGYTSPNQKLDVNGNIGIPGTNKIVFNNEPGAWYIHARTTTSTSFMGTQLKNMIICGGGVSEGLAIGGTGTGDASFEVTNGGLAKVKSNLSIGTNSIEEVLTVGGNIYVADGQTTGLGVILQNGDRPMITRGWDAFTSGSYTGIGRWGLFMEAGTTFLASPGSDYTNGLVSLGGYTASGTAQYNLTVNNYTRRVGIGTTTPSVKLQVSDGSTLPLKVESDNSVRTELAVDNISTNNVRLGLKATSGGAIIDSTNHTTGSVQPLLFQINSSTKMQIDTSGRVGINQSSPATDSILSMTSGFQYAIQIDHNIANASTDFQDSLFIKNTNNSNSNYVSLGMSTRGTDGQHHRVQIRAYKGSSGNYEGQLRFHMRQTNATNLEKYRFYANGEFHADNDIVAFSTTISDKRLKDNVVTIDSALDKVKQLRGVEYVWNTGSKKGKKDLGVIAQEVEEILPEIVTEKEMAFFGEEKYKTVDYEKLTAVLIESVKELSAKVEALENKNC